jgi:site-specific recombinase XerD
MTGLVPLYPLQTALKSRAVIPAAIAAGGEHAVRRFLEFFGATIRNKNTRKAYIRAVTEFFAWLEQHGVRELPAIEPFHVAAYIEDLQDRKAKPTVKQHLAAVRTLFDWLVIGHVVAVNPATSVRGPKHIVHKGTTPVLTPDQTRALFESIDTSTLIGLRDRALIAVMAYAFARIGAVVAMRVEDYRANGQRWWVRLHEKGGKRHELPAHHKLAVYLDDYICAAGLRDRKGPLFCAARGRTGELSTRKAMHANDAYRMIRRRAEKLGIKVNIGCHSFRATGITTYLEAGGTLESAQAMAAHASPRTTKLYDRTRGVDVLSEVERITVF